MMRADQWLPAAHHGDAIGDETLRFRDALRRAGFQSDIYALHIDQDVSDEFLPFSQRAEPGSGDLTILHFALPSPLTEAFRDARGRRVLIYHNITPARYFIGLDDELVRIAGRGRMELASLCESVDLALGDSEFNRRELEELGFGRTGVLPILVDFDRYRGPRCQVLSELLDDDRCNFLFVGRVYPNKRFEDLLRLAFFYKKYVSENFRFLLVGRAGRMWRYQEALTALAEVWGLRTSELMFTGHLAWDELLACYDMADVFIGMSEHEGFCVPLVESMLLEVPVMAYAAGAVPDTLGEAGVLFYEKNLEEMAEMAQRLGTDQEMRAAVVHAQNQRVGRFRPERVEAELLDYVEEVFR